MVLPHGVRGGVGTSPKYRRVAHVANVSKLAFIKNMKRLLHEIELTPNS